MPIPDQFQVIQRIRRRIAEMVVEYQNNGRYLGMDGQEYTNTKGILDAWDELESLGGKL